MPNYRRYYVPGGTYFFTVVTCGRRPILCTDAGRAGLRAAIESVRADRPFELTAVALLPDHLHAIWTLPAGDADYSGRWGLVKERFTRAHLAGGGAEVGVSRARRRQRERGVWQPRFWEHTVRDEDDFKRCLDYTHWNPVKHGLVSRVRGWPWSSFGRYVALGEYEPDWGSAGTADVSGAEWE